MFKSLSHAVVPMIMFVVQLSSGDAAFAEHPERCHTKQKATDARVIYKVVQNTPEYDLGRPEVVSGTRVTLFANFLGQDPGVVQFNMNQTSASCKITDWQPNVNTGRILQRRCD
ncbi:MAG: hypothetical protein RIC12_01115 [Pirellulales bacterium]